MAVILEQNHTLLYKSGLFIISLMVVICISISLVIYDNVSDSTADNGISAKTADSAYVFFVIFLIAAVLYMVYRFIVLVVDPKFKSGVKITFDVIKETVSDTASYIKENIPSIPSITSSSSSVLGTGGGYKLVNTGGVVKIV